LDFDKHACETYEKNLGLKPICGKIEDYCGSGILEHFNIKKGDVDILVGCPPCQGFSNLRRTRHKEMIDDRRDLVKIFSDRVKEISPKVVIFENVPGIANLWGLPYFTNYLKKLSSLGYRNSWDYFDAANYGVPQHRKRVICLSVKGASNQPDLPPPTHSNPKKNDDLAPWKTVRDTIASLPVINAGECDPRIANHVARGHSEKVMNLIQKIPKNGGSRTSLPEDMWLSCHKKLEGAWSIYGRLSWDKPSGTMTCRCTSPSTGRFLHPEQDRAITAREAALLQSFPINYHFPEAIGIAEKQIGNAVPSEFFTVFAETAIECLKEV